MAKRRTKLRLTSGEMDLLSMLWSEGPLTLSTAHRVFGKKYGHSIGYPTIQTRLNRLVEKGLASRSDQRPAKYGAAVNSEQVALGHLDQLLEKLTSLSVAPLVCHLISERPLSPAELSELRKTLAELEQSAQKPTSSTE